MKKCVICGKIGDELLCTNCIADGCDNVVKFVKGPGKYIGVFILGVYIGNKIHKKSDRHKS